MSYDRRAHARLFLALTMEDAKEILGFPPGAVPSPEEINKAYKREAVKNHPDRGGNPAKMVELNVAKEILEGKRTRDLTQRYDDPEAKAKAEAERKLNRDRDTIIQAGMLAGASLRDALSSLRSGVLPGWRMDMKAYLNDDYADILDQLHDAADDALRGALEGQDKQVWQKVLAASRDLAADSARTASKFGSIKTRANAIATSNLSIEEVQRLFSDAEKIADAVKSLYVASGKLMTVMFTTETVPLDLSELYSTKGHQLLIAFKDGFEKISDRDLKKAEDLVEKSVKDAMKVLKEYDVADGFGDWKKWNALTDFASAVEVITKKGAKTASERILDRFRKQTSRG